MIRILAIAIALAGAASVAVGEEVYRFTDAQGRVQYSDRWVPGSVLVKTSNVRATPSALEAQSSADQGRVAQRNDEVNDQIANAESQRTVQQDVAKTREQQCKEATERYEKAIQARRLYKEGPNKERVYASDTEADSYRIQALNDKKAACGS
jgi:uncharacterized protein YigA (DUF484 family)